MTLDVPKIDIKVIIGACLIASCLCSSPARAERAAAASIIGVPLPGQDEPLAKRDSASQVKSSQSQNDRQSRIADWFVKYDNIRHAAQMKPGEKSKAHQLVNAAVSGTQQEKQQSQALLSSMTQRYDRAVKDLSALPYIPETAELQQQYLKYFKMGRDFFSSSLKQMSSKDSLNLVQMQEGRRQLSIQSVQNKMLDKSLRSKYHIKPYQWD
jgi:hypothetical protein